jgi:hypothetical protein
MVHHEGLLELDAIYLFETSPRVVCYREQPSTLRYPDGPRLRRYTADFELTLSTGSCVLIEVKSRRSLTEPAIQHKLDCIANYLDRSAQTFVILDDDTLRREPRQSNLRSIYHQAPRIPLSTDSCRVALDRHAVQFPLSIESAACLLRARAVDPFSLLLAGLVRCDLDHPISGKTLLHLAKEGSDVWFHIAQGHDF